MTTGITTKSNHKSTRRTVGFTLAALGVVYGDIGTSPMYAIQEIFFGHAKIVPNVNDILGNISLVFWALMVIVSLKYLTIVLNAGNDGEGGTFALFSRLHSQKDKISSILKTLLMIAAGLLFGEGIITPAISVLSAVEGLKTITPNASEYILPLTTLILVVMFGLQKHGSTKVGRFYGPIAILWFVVLGWTGAVSVLQGPEILQALNPVHGLNALMSHDLSHNLWLLGALVLVITGGEALFADMGHFGIGPIRIGWFTVVMPALMLNYLGQGSFLLTHPQFDSSVSLFFAMSRQGLLSLNFFQDGLLTGFVILSTLAAVIASQALISGAFALSSQAVALGLLPRLKVIHTHEDHSGQTYLPVVNGSLFLGSVTLVWAFQSSAALAGAYGFALSMVMLVTSLVLMFIAVRHWHWPRWKSVMVFLPFVIIDLSFVCAKSLSFKTGGWVSVFVGVIVFSIMWSWKWGRKATFASYTSQKTMTIGELIEIKERSEMMVHKNLIFMVQNTVKDIQSNTPALVQMYLNRYHYMPEHILLVQVVHLKTPYANGPRHESKVLYKSSDKGSLINVVLFFGFMEEPNVEKVLEELATHHELELPQNPHKWLVHVSHENLIPPTDLGLLESLKFKMFLFLRQITQPAYYYYGLGRDVNLSMDILPVVIPPQRLWKRLVRRL